MAAREDLPEELVLNIFSRLPVKSLIRFSTVSKRMHSIIFSDPKFAQLQFRLAARLSRRLLFVSTDLELLQLDVDTLSFGDPSFSVRKLTLPFQLQPGDYVTLLSSCNGLVFLTTHPQLESSPIFFEHSFYIWNPSLGYFKKLPDLSFSSLHDFNYYGVGYVCSIDDYRVLVGYYADSKYNFKMFSLRTQIWETIDSPAEVVLRSGEGTLFNDALHGINCKGKRELVCFDLAVKQFRRMRVPSFDNDKHYSKLTVYGGCLSVVRYRSDSIYLWVMKEYEVSDSWTMLFSLKLSDLPKNMQPWFVMESSTVAVSWTWPPKVCELIMIDHKDGQRLGQYMLQGVMLFMIVYEESLLWISDYDSVEKTEQVQELESLQKGFTKLK